MKKLLFLPAVALLFLSCKGTVVVHNNWVQPVTIYFGSGMENEKEEGTVAVNQTMTFTSPQGLYDLSLIHI